jgi:hypothetical protein
VFVELDNRNIVMIVPFKKELVILVNSEMIGGEFYFALL